MTDKQKQKREALRVRLIDAAETIIVEKGLGGLKARDVTTKAGCALGALYNIVDGLDELVVLVNSRTLAALGAALKESIPSEAAPSEAMLALAGAYVEFSVDNPLLWSAVFNHKMSDGAQVPDWHAAEYPVLIREIIEPLSQLRPDLSREAVQLRAQTLFAAVHGVVYLSIHGRFVGVPTSSVDSEVKALLEALMRGINLVSP